jgi:hypothetical protein
MDKITLELKELIQEWRDAGYADEEILAKCKVVLGIKEG